ncbi:energy-coupling factor transport system permease protein [Pilibacter termitis]|uniref:Energy-coupling factor transporter transmembrane protein EcfT n=1 Tax=Pilibacter termitis TaxID=263852 RepID=A0A1T4L1B1_9ENTE|nr:energy-coupling factor transporter transmembrane component T [Pilibacter termitis]SJZ48504.1 energy-coupling factor transport system permease protein [Pilibacter termitis]
MMDKLILGRFIPGDSVIHRLDPRAKLIATFYFIMIIFLANNAITYGILTIFTLLAIFLSGLSFSFFLKGVRPMLFLILFTVLLQIFFTTGGKELFAIGPLKITEFGLVNAGFIFMRFVLIIFISTLMTLSTTPLSLSDALESILSPLNAIKFPVHEISLMLSIALRFVPTLMDETEKIMNAQRARGVDFSEGSLIQKMKAVVPLLIPLFVSSFKRAEDLSDAMEARGYQGGEGRTRYRKLDWAKRDSISIGAMALLTLFLFLFRR